MGSLLAAFGLRRYGPKQFEEMGILMRKMSKTHWYVQFAVYAFAILLAPQARAGFVVSTLGAAGPGNWAILALNPAVVIGMNGPGTTHGNIGVSGGGDLQLNGSAPPEVVGDVYFQGSANFSGGACNPPTMCGQLVGSIHPSSSLVTQADSDAANAETIFAAKPFTQSVSGNAITGTTTVTALNPGEINVIDITSLNLGNGQILTLSGPAGTQFIINDSGGFTLNSGMIVETGGLGETDVVINLTSSQQLSTSGGLNNESVINGIILAPQSDINMAPGRINGELIAGTNHIQIVSGGAVAGGATVPEPVHTSFVLTGLLAAIILGTGYRNRRRSVRKA